MKKAFNKVVAIAAALPIALTQGLSVVTYAEVAEPEVFSVDSMLYIAPDKTESEWGTKAESALIQMEGVNQTLDVASILDAAHFSGKNAEYVEKLKACLVGDPVVQVKDSVIYVTGQVDATSYVQSNIIQAIKNELTKQGAASLVDKIDFSMLEKKGTYTAVVNGYGVSDSKTFVGGGNFVDEDGNTVTPSTAKAYIASTVQDLKVELTTKMAMYDTYADLTDLLDTYQKKLNKAYDYANKAFEKVYSNTFADADSFAAWAQAEFYERTTRFEVPGSVAELAEYSDILNKVVEEVNSIASSTGAQVTFDVTMDDVIATLNEASNFTFDAADSVYTVTFQVPDAEADDVKVAYEAANPDREYVSSYKTVTIKGTLSEASAYFNVVRTITDKEKDETSTTTTTTTVSSETTTTTSETTTTVSGDSTTTTSDTTTTVSGDSTTTTSDTTTTVSGDSTTTTSDTTTTVSDDSTTTTSDTTTTTTDTTPVVPVGTTTLVIEVNPENFYFSVDERAFDPADLFSKFIAIDEEGTQFDMLSAEGAVSFDGATPKSVYDDAGAPYYVGEVKATFTNPFDPDAEPVAVEVNPTVYIGVKGDTNLSGLVQVEDSVAMLSYYASAAANLSPKFVEDDEVLNKFVYFLSDIDTEAKTGENVAGVNTISVEDAVSNLSFYAQQSAALDPQWPDVVPSLKSLEGSCWYEG
ncbi:MAG: cellulose-binding protein CttA-related protein [Ruminococcus sp.]